MFESIEILASSKTVDEMVERAKDEGENVRKITVYDGPVPPDSYIDLGFYRMSRPEYMFYRKANELPHDEAVRLGSALLSHYDTSLTSSVAEGVAEDHGEPHMTVASFLEYVAPVFAWDESERPIEILRESARNLEAFEAECAAICG